MVKIGVIVVTYNRLEKLKKAIRLLEMQSYSPEYILVVNNASTDGTEEYLDKWQKDTDSSIKKIIINLKSNTGGSGGFYAGLKCALKQNADWIWVSDDDAFPEINALEVANDFLEKNINDVDNISAICSSVVTDGQFDYVHRKRYKRKLFGISVENVKEEEYKNEQFDINAFSYVGTILNKVKLEEAGITESSFFIMCDDTEHSLRLSRVGRIICIPSMRVNHYRDISPKKSGMQKYSWKTYYGYRNELVMFMRHFPFRCYVFIMVKRWIKLLLISAMKVDKDYVDLYHSALTDAIRGNMGKNDAYQLSWGKEGQVIDLKYYLFKWKKW